MELNSVFLIYEILMQASDEEKYDLVREGVVIFTGALAKHLAKVLINPFKKLTLSE